FVRSLLDKFSSELNQPDQLEVLDHGLLERDGDSLELHDVLRVTGSPGKTLGRADVPSIHRLLAGYYLECADSGGASSHLTNALEAYHHAATANDEELLESIRPFFVE